jgi:hypothetical protein
MRTYMCVHVCAKFTVVLLLKTCCASTYINVSARTCVCVCTKFTCTYV